MYKIIYIHQFQYVQQYLPKAWISDVRRQSRPITTIFIFSSFALLFSKIRCNYTEKMKPANALFLTRSGHRLRKIFAPTSSWFLPAPLPEVGWMRKTQWAGGIHGGSKNLTQSVNTAHAWMRQCGSEIGSLSYHTWITQASTPHHVSPGRESRLGHSRGIHEATRCFSRVVELWSLKLKRRLFDIYRIRISIAAADHFFALSVLFRKVAFTALRRVKNSA